MTLDKDDLFRNVVPGFIFATVILSVNGSLFKFTDPQAFLSIAAAFPMGFIIQTIHRALHFSCEQKIMRKTEYELVHPKSKLVDKIIGLDLKEEKWDTFAQIVAFSLDKDENQHFKIRINFSNS